MESKVESFLKRNKDALPLLSELTQKKCAILAEACKECAKTHGNDNAVAVKKLNPADRKLLAQIEDEIGHLIEGNELAPVQKLVAPRQAIPTADPDERIIEQLYDAGSRTMMRKALIDLGLKTKLVGRAVKIGAYMLKRSMISYTYEISKTGCGCKLKTA
jgi:hypothetical protein